MANHRLEISRLLKIHATIASGERPTVAELAERCEVGPRTIKRDITMLKQELNAPICVSRTRGEEGYYYERPFRLAPEPFTDQEVLALSVALQVADTFRNMLFVPAIKGALQKLRQMQVEADRQISEMSGHISLMAEPAPREDVQTTIHFNELLKAIEQCRQVHMTYYTMSRDEESTRIVDPYHLYHYDGLWYLYGYCHARAENRDFAVNRIRQLTLSDHTFTAPSTDDIRCRLSERYANISGTPTKVTIHFDKTVARYIRERIWHFSQELTVQKDGSCDLTMTVTGLDTVTRWVLSFGPHAMPLAPVRFVNNLKKDTLAMAARWEQNTSGE